MPSAALTHWQTDRMIRLGLVDAHCGALLAMPGVSASASAGPPSPRSLADESLEGYVVLLSGHFQGFCRDLYRESTQVIAKTLPMVLQDMFQTQCGTDLKLNMGNATLENIRKDFERFDFSLDLAHAAPSNQGWVTHLGHLNHWRNVVAHQKPTSPPAGVPAVLTLAGVQSWRAACDGLATSLDAILYQEPSQMLSAAPW